MVERSHVTASSGLTRRDLMLAGAAGVAIGVGSLMIPRRYFRMPQQAQAFVANVAHYQAEIADVIVRGIRELGVVPEELQGKRILLKPNLVERWSGRLENGAAVQSEGISGLEMRRPTRRTSAAHVRRSVFCMDS